MGIFLCFFSSVSSLIFLSLWSVSLVAWSDLWSNWVSLLEFVAGILIARAFFGIVEGLQSSDCHSLHMSSAYLPEVWVVAVVKDGIERDVSRIAVQYDGYLRS